MSLKISLKFVRVSSHQQYSSNVSDDGLAPARWQAVICSSDGKFTDTYMRQSASLSWYESFYDMELTTVKWWRDNQSL